MGVCVLYLIFGSHFNSPYILPAGQTRQVSTGAAHGRNNEPNALHKTRAID